MENWGKNKQIEKAQQRTDELFPGKNLQDIYQMYLEFFKEFDQLRKADKSHSMEMLTFLNKNRDLIEIVDYFPEPEAPSWEAHRQMLESLLLNKQEQFFCYGCKKHIVYYI